MLRERYATTVLDLTELPATEDTALASAPARPARSQAGLQAPGAPAREGLLGQRHEGRRGVVEEGEDHLGAPDVAGEDHPTTPRWRASARRTSSVLPMKSGTRWWYPVAATSRMRSVPVLARPPACSATRASGAAS